MQTKHNEANKALQNFSTLMIKKIESLSEGDTWRKPWFAPGCMADPVNLDGRVYSGLNSLMLLAAQDADKHKLPVWATFKVLDEMNYHIEKGKRVFYSMLDGDGNKLPMVHVKKGEKGTPIFYPARVIFDASGEKISEKAYKELDPDERKDCRVIVSCKVYTVFNVEQTNLSESRPELYKQLCDKYEVAERTTLQGVELPGIDDMVAHQGWICPIEHEAQDKAYYSPAKDSILMPTREQFKDTESYYGNLLHECAHSTGRKDMFNRLEGVSSGSKAYAREELVAELTAAFVLAGKGVTKHLKDDSAVYLRSWLNALKESTSFIDSILTDVRKASEVINERTKEIA